MTAWADVARLARIDSAEPALVMTCGCVLFPSGHMRQPCPMHAAEYARREAEAERAAAE